MSSIGDPAKLKVVELRAELSSRGLDTKGNKAVLVKRLKDALEEETGDDFPDTSIADTSTDDINTSVSRKSPSPEPQKDPSPQPVSISSSPETVEPSDEYEVTKAPADDSDPEKMEVEEPKKETPVSKKEPIKDDPPPEPVQIPPEPVKAVSTQQKDEEEMESEDVEDSAPTDENGEIDDSAKSDSAEPRNRKSRWGSVPEASEASETPMQEESAEVQASEQSVEARGEKRRRSTSRSPERAAKIRSKSPVKEDEPELSMETVHLSWVDSDLNLQIDKSNFLSAKPFHDGAFGWMWAGARASCGVKSGKVFYEVKITEECNWDDAPKAVVQTDVPKPAKSEEKAVENKEETKEGETEMKEENGAEPEKEKNGEETKEEEKPSEEEKPKEEENPKEEEKPKEEDKPKEEEAAEPKQEPPVIKKPLVHLLRLGWSTSCSSLQLGESKYSYGYESTGQTIQDCGLNCFGETFGVGDVVASYLDLTSDPATITYTVNGKQLDVAFSIPHSEFPEEGLTLFPHVLTRNYAFEVNFGSRDEPLGEQPPQLEDYVYISQAEEKIDGPKRPEERKTCEVILMCGLPASGKTHWVREHVAKNPEKRYTVLGSKQLIERMNVNAKPLKESWQGKWTVLLDKCTRCINKLQDIAGTRRRNYILDQTNVFSSAQRRKLRPFEGFHRRAVVVVVADEEQATRERAQQDADGKDVPDTAVLEMKASMNLPATGDCVDEITWVGLGEEEAKAAVQKYNQLGKAAGYGQNQRRNSRDNRSQWHNRNNNRRNDYRDNRDNRNNRWGGGGGQRQGGPGGWNNHRSGGGGSAENRPRRDDRGGSGGGPRGNWRHNGGNNPRHGGGAGGYNNRNQQVSSYNPRGQRNQGGGHRNQGSGSWSQGGGSWGGQGGSWGSGGQGQSWGGQGSWQGSGSGNWQGGQGQGSGQQQWKGYGGQQQGGGYQGYAQGYQNYPNWNYYGQYAQNWNPQGQTGSSGSTASTDNSSNQYNQYTQQQQAAWAQYAQQGYGGYSASSSSTPSANTSNPSINK